MQAALAAALADRPGEVVASVGVGAQPVDLAVRDETAATCWQSSATARRSRKLPTARDRDRLRQEMLDRLGWQLHRVWSTDWIGSQPDEIKRVLAAVERARQLRDGLPGRRGAAGGVEAGGPARHWANAPGPRPPRRPHAPVRLTEALTPA